MKLVKIALLVLLSICISFTFSVSYGKSAYIKKPDLRFKSDGTFKIVQFADCQDGPLINFRTVNLMNNILDYEKPDLVVFTGDNIDANCKTTYEIKAAIDNIAQPLEKRSISWAIVFGNHDGEHAEMSKVDMMNIYMSYPHNLSKIGYQTLDGVGNYNLLIKSSKGDNPVFNVYMLDSRRINHVGQGQIQWYKATASNIKNKYNKIVPSIMFFHIPLPEWNDVWNSGNAIGSKNEEVCISSNNHTLFTSVLETGDVKGIFVGHDHINDFAGELNGIKLGYSRSIGFHSYGKDGFARGARVFLINEADPYNFDTWMRLASDFDKGAIISTQ